MQSLKEVVKRVTDVLSETGLDYVFVGGLAVAGWGNVRTTRDIDVIIDLREDDMERLAKTLIDEGFEVTIEDIQDALREKTHFTVFDSRSDFHLDVKGAYSERERRTLQTRKAVRLWEGIFISNPEDTIAHKLLFGSEQDIKDADGIYARQLERLDLNYLDEIAAEMGVKGELDELKKRVEKQLPNGA